MARIASKNVPDNKRVLISLTYIYGIGKKSSENILIAAKVNPDKRVANLSDDEIKRIREEISKSYIVEGDLKKQVMSNIKSMMDLGSYRGLRHRVNLPVRGQNTHNNARTRKGPAKTIANKKK